MIRKSNAVDNLLYLSRNVKTARALMLQIDDMFKHLMDVYK